MMNSEQVTSGTESQFMLTRSVSGLLAMQARRFGSNDMLVLPQSVQVLWPEERSKWSYAAMHDEIAALSARYASAGFGFGDRVAILLENRPVHFIHWLALNALGASIVPINPRASAEELEYLLVHSHACSMVRLASYAQFADPIATRLGLATFGPSDDIPQASAPLKLVSSVTLDTECALIYTSGTTGEPKGCMLSNRYFLNWADWYSAQAGLIQLREGAERLLTPLPTFHVNALGHSFMGMLSCGGTQIILDRFHPRSWWQDAVETGATCFHFLGVMPAILLELPEKETDRAHGMRFGLGGGTHTEHHAKFEARFGTCLLEGYAMTETGGAATFCCASEPRHVGQRCIGRPDRPGPAVETRLVDDAGIDVPNGTPGELLLRAPGADPRKGFFSGYLNNHEATEAAWQGGWLHTGDLVRRDDEGSMFFVERKKNIIRRSGENIAAAEVEAVIAMVNSVSAVAVVAAPDPLREEEVLAVIVAKNDQDFGAVADAIFERCAQRMAYFKVPAYIIPVDSLPTTSTQKLQKAALRPLAESPLKVDGCVDFRERKNALGKISR